MSIAMGLAVFAAHAEVSARDFPLALQLAILSGAGGALYFALAHFLAGALERDVFRALLKKA
jgi:hypothetical protein